MKKRKIRIFTTTNRRKNIFPKYQINNKIYKKMTKNKINLIYFTLFIYILDIRLTNGNNKWRQSEDSNQHQHHYRHLTHKESIAFNYNDIDYSNDQRLRRSYTNENLHMNLTKISHNQQQQDELEISTTIPKNSKSNINDFLQQINDNSSTLTGLISTIDDIEAALVDTTSCPYGNCTNSTAVLCDDDTVPCNATYEEYMQFLYEYAYPTVAEWILIGSHCVIFITGLVGNALVCIAVYTNYSMRTVTNVFIVNLAVADFFVIFICLPPTVVWDVTETWFLGESMCKIVVYFQSVSVTVSVLTLTFISVDRWYAICFPLRYRTKITRAVASVAFIWTVALLSDLPEFLSLTLYSLDLRYETVLFTQCATNWGTETEKMFFIIRTIMLYILPLILMTIAYFKIVRVLWRSETIPGHRESRNHHQYSCKYTRGTQIAPPANTSTMGQLRARRKAAKMLVAVVVMFAVCYFPVYAFNILRYFKLITSGELTSIFSLLSHWLCYANSAINPIIYNFMSGKFRREFRNALVKCRCATVRVEDRSLNHSTPAASRLNNVSPSSRSNYQLTSVRDITRDHLTHQPTMQTTFTENCINGHTTTLPVYNNNNSTTVGIKEP